MASALKRQTRRPGSVEQRPDLRRERAPVKRRPGAGPGAECVGEPTLESKLLTTWAALIAGYPVECPVCGGPLTAAHGCSRCGSRLT